MLSGEINGTGLLDLFKFLLSQNQTGTITVSNTSGSGSVQVRSGEITFAKWQEKIAEQAFYEMIKLNSLKFTFEQDYAVETNIKTLTESLLKAASVYIYLQNRLCQSTVLVRNPLKEGGQIAIDPDKWLIAGFIGSGITYSNLVSSLSFSEEETKKLVNEMLDEGMIAIKKAEIKKDIFLIPKITKTKLNANESEIFSKITIGTRLADLFESMSLSIDDFADMMCVLCLKNAISVIDEYSKAVDMSKLYDILDIQRIAHQKELIISIGNSRHGQVFVDEYLYDMWIARLRGQKIDSVEFRNIYYKPVFSVTKMRNLDERAIIAQIDAKKLGLKDGDVVSCAPCQKGD
ncbi:MAG TPA: DUF4388 domain-containing protein [Caldisericia bacterium]|nr:DUF4388 domain-containing protein [Caldisericia bacterium]